MSQTNLPPNSAGAGQDLCREINRLLSAAVISQRFRKLLLANPGKALEMGYAGERFHLPREAKRRMSNIQAANLADFADQLHRGMDALAAGSWSGD